LLYITFYMFLFFFFFQAEDGIRDRNVTGVQTCALPISTEFNGALLSWTGSLWEMQFRDGSVASFLDCQKDQEVCSLVERRDPDDHRIAYVRDQSGLLLKMESEGQSIAFDYDDRKRIVRAYDTSQREVSYAYDDRGRLVRATGSDGIVRTYEYNDRNNLVRV